MELAWHWLTLKRTHLLLHNRVFHHFITVTVFYNYTLYSVLLNIQWSSQYFPTCYFTLWVYFRKAKCLSRAGQNDFTGQMTFDRRKRRESGRTSCSSSRCSGVGFQAVWPPKGAAHIQTGSKVKNPICISARVSSAGCSRGEMWSRGRGMSQSLSWRLQSAQCWIKSQRPVCTLIWEPVKKK